MVRKLSQAVIDRLMKKYKKRLGAKVPTFAKKGGHVRKKTKKK